MVLSALMLKLKMDLQVKKAPSYCGKGIIFILLDSDPKLLPDLGNLCLFHPFTWLLLENFILSHSLISFWRKDDRSYCHLAGHLKWQELHRKLDALSRRVSPLLWHLSILFMMEAAGRCDILTPDLTPHEHFLCSCPVCLLPSLASSCGAGLALSLGYTQRWHVAAVPLWLLVCWHECQAEQEAAKVKCWCKSVGRAGWCSLAVMLGGEGRRAG